jgi:hypothetical protein
MFTSCQSMKEGGATGRAGCSMLFRSSLTVLLGILTLGIGNDARAQAPGSSVAPGGDTIPLAVVAASDFHFSDVVDVVELRDGGVLVLDRVARHVFRLDASLTDDPMPIGTHGEGPGEYVSPRLLRGLAGDSIGIHDGNLGRLTVLDPEAGFARTIREDGMERSFGRDIDRMGRGYLAVGPDTPFRGRGAPADGKDRVEVWDLNERGWRTVAAVEAGSLVVSEQHTLLSRRIIFEARPTWAVAPDGTVAVLSADPYQVPVFSKEDGRIDGPEIPFEPVAVTEAQKEAWRAATASPRPMETGRLGAPPGETEITMTRLPPPEPGGWADVMPPFHPGSARFSPDGPLWVPRIVDPGERTRADLFNREGVRTARVVLEAGTRIVGFGEGVVYVVEQNEYGEEAVLRLSEPES